MAGKGRQDVECMVGSANGPGVSDTEPDADAPPLASGESPVVVEIDGLVMPVAPVPDPDVPVDSLAGQVEACTIIADSGPSLQGGALSESSSADATISPPHPGHDMPGLMAPQPSLPTPPLAFWRRSLVLGGVVAVLGGLSLWENSTVPDRPARPVVTLATQAPGASPAEASTVEALRRLRSALQARDVVALSGAVDPDGLIVAPFSGGVPESGYAIPDTRSFLSDVVTDARLVALGWRVDSRGRVFILSDGWRSRPLRLSPNSTLELSPLVALVLQNRNGTWHLRWFLIDATGALTQQARNLAWQAIP